MMSFNYRNTFPEQQIDTEFARFILKMAQTDDRRLFETARRCAESERLGSPATPVADADTSGVAELQKLYPQVIGRFSDPQAELPLTPIIWHERFNSLFLYRRLRIELDLAAVLIARKPVISVIPGAPHSGKTAKLLQLISDWSSALTFDEMLLTAGTGADLSVLAAGLHHRGIAAAAVDFRTALKQLRQQEQQRGFPHCRSLKLVAVDAAHALSDEQFYELVRLLPPSSRLLISGTVGRGNRAETGCVFDELVRGWQLEAAPGRPPEIDTAEAATEAQLSALLATEFARNSAAPPLVIAFGLSGDRGTQNLNRILRTIALPAAGKIPAQLKFSRADLPAHTLGQVSFEAGKWRFTADFAASALEVLLDDTLWEPAWALTPEQASGRSADRAIIIEPRWESRCFSSFGRQLALDCARDSALIVKSAPAVSAAPEKLRTSFLHAYLKGEAPLCDLAESEQLNFPLPD